MTYQREIQGLRAIAVVAVILDHMDIGPFSGGFLGVDVFFVISGFLITGLLCAEHARERRVSLGRFYGRRIRRLLPALIVTCVATVAFGFLTLSNERFERLLDSALAALGSVSNVLFWSEVGYFDAEAASKPLLHTWSLGVEEQFYLVWPLVMWLLLRSGGSRARQTGWVLALALLSFLLNLGLVRWGLSTVIGAEGDSLRSRFLDGESTAFYWMPCRVFELGIGAALSIATDGKPVKLRPQLADALLVAGVLTLVCAFVSVTQYDPLLGLLAATCAALVMNSAASSRIGSWLLANRLIVWLGGLSYSLYLVHWPLVVYFGLLGGKRGFLHLAGLLCTMLCLAYLLHAGVERPLRAASFLVAPSPGWRGLLAKLAIPTAVIVCAAWVVALHDVGDRVPAERAPENARHSRKAEKRKYCRGKLQGFPAALFGCINDRRAHDTIVVWGDSHARHLVAGLSKAFRRANIAIAEAKSCSPQLGFQGFSDQEQSAKDNAKCAARNQSVLRWLKQYPGALTVLLTGMNRGTPEQVAPINHELVRELREAGHPAYVLGDFVGPSVFLADCHAVPDFVISDALLREICQPDRHRVSEHLRYAAAMARLSDHYIPVHDIQCPKGECSFVDDHGRLVHYDRHHLTITGSIYEVARVMPRIRAAMNADAQR